jgi:hypothetical protein
MGCALKTNNRHCLFSNVRTRGLSLPNRDAKHLVPPPEYLTLVMRTRLGLGAEAEGK